MLTPMSSSTIVRVAARSQPTTFLRSSYNIRTRVPKLACTSPAVVSCGSAAFSTTSRKQSTSHEEETFEEFTARYEKEFEGVQDAFELQRNLNNCFAYDLVPGPSVIAAALRAARRANDYPTAVRVFEGIKAKVENRGQYMEYVEELKDLREELGVDLKEELFPNEPDKVIP